MSYFFPSKYVARAPHNCERICLEIDFSVHVKFPNLPLDVSQLFVKVLVVRHIRVSSLLLHDLGHLLLDLHLVSEPPSQLLNLGQKKQPFSGPFAIRIDFQTLTAITHFLFISILVRPQRHRKELTMLALIDVGNRR